MPKKDGLVRLPDHVTAGLLRALMSIRPRPESRLLLQRSEHGRMPGYDQQNDYNVLWRGHIIGRIWKHDYTGHPWEKMPVWHWRWSDVPGRSETKGHAPTLEAAMAVVSIKRATRAMPSNPTVI
jgi:hypothetical protein